MYFWGKLSWLERLVLCSVQRVLRFCSTRRVTHEYITMLGSFGGGRGSSVAHVIVACQEEVVWCRQNDALALRRYLVLPILLVGTVTFFYC